MTGLKIGYACVSTDEKDLTAQRDALATLGVAADCVYVGRGLTGTNRDRPGLRGGTGSLSRRRHARRHQARPARAVMRRATAAHGWLYRVTGGKLGGSVGGQPVLLLTTTGRRSGRPRTTPVQYVRDGPRLIIVAANGGAPRPPAWWLNLCAYPRAQVRIGADSREVVAVEATDAERERLWRSLTDHGTDYPRVQERAGRQLPLVKLETPRPTPDG